MAIKILATADEIKELSKNIPTAILVVRCQECAVKRAVQRRDGIVWRCPHRTNDVDMNGYCECGTRIKKPKEDR